MKKTLLIILALIMCLSLCSCERLLKKAKAYVTGTEESEPPADFLESRKNELFEYDLFKDHVTITAYIGESGSVTIPSEIDGRAVTAIGSLAFFECADVTSVHIPSSVNEIQESAFYCCDKLTTVLVPNSVKTIGNRAFAWCNSLKTVSLGNGVEAIPDYCFNHCESLVTVVIPSGIKSIGVRAFSYCDNLKEISIPASVASVGDLAFTGDPALEYVSFSSGAGPSLGKKVFENSPGVILVAPEESNAKAYCIEYGLRWSTSKATEAIIPADPNKPVEDASEEITEDTSALVEG